MKTTDDQNLGYFRKIYGNSQPVDQWYWNVARRHLLDRGKVYSLDISKNQTGGAKVDYVFQYDRNMYTMSIVVSEGTDDDETKFSVYFLHIGEPSLSRHCAFIRIYRDSDTGILGKLDGLSNRLDRPSDKEGRVIMTGILKFCRQQKTFLGIKFLELSDMSRYHCKDPVTLKPIIGQDKYTIELPVSRFLTGQLPYYMQFGFVPEDPSVNEIIKMNLEKMKRLSTKDYPLLSKFRKWNPDINPNIVHFIMDNSDVPLSETLYGLANLDCFYYKSIYNRLFDDLGLARLEDEELNFIIEL